VVENQRGVVEMLNWLLKSCPRCGGDVYIDRDADGWFEQCLQCSYRKELVQLKNRLVPVTVRRFPQEDWSKQRDD
jgi:ribosomal protein S27AE